MQLDEINRKLGALDNGQAAIIQRQDRFEESAASERETMNEKLDALIRQVSQASGGLAVGRAMVGVIAWLFVAAGGSLSFVYYAFWPKSH